MARQHFGVSTRVNDFVWHRGMCWRHSAIAVAIPAPGDTTAASAEQLRTLVSRKRDIQSDGTRAVVGWLKLMIIGDIMIRTAVVAGAMALISHLRGES